MTTDGLVADGYAALDEGRWADARAAFEAADGERETAEGCFGLAIALWWLGENHECVGRCTRAYALYRRDDDAPGAARCAVWLAITYKSNFGNFAAANGWVGRAERLLRGLEPGPHHGWLCIARAYRMHRLAGHRSLLAAALDLLVEARLAAGDLDGARASAARLAELASTADPERCAALAAAAQGRVAMAAGDDDAAAEHLGMARVAWARLELPFELARTRADLARLLAGRQPELAIEHARRALAIFEELGAALDGDRVASFLRSLGVTARTGVKGHGDLTGREQEVLRLVGAGLSNPEIAQRLHISRKTASHHVSSILTKLNLRNRTEAAAYTVTALGPSRDPA